MSGKDNVCTSKEPEDQKEGRKERKKERKKKKRTMMPVLEYMEVMAKLDRGNEHWYYHMLLWFKQINSLFHGRKCWQDQGKL